MNDTSAAAEPEDQASTDRTNSTRERSATKLVAALDEARFAELRVQLRTSITGQHGENFEQRWPRVQQIVATHNARAVEDARQQALAAGWTESELAGRGLDSHQ